VVPLRRRTAPAGQRPNKQEAREKPKKPLRLALLRTENPRKCTRRRLSSPMKFKGPITHHLHSRSWLSVTYCGGCQRLGSAGCKEICAGFLDQRDDYSSTAKGLKSPAPLIRQRCQFCHTFRNCWHGLALLPNLTLIASIPWVEELRLSDTKARARAETLFNREKRREAEIADALQQEQVRHDNVIRNMQRLRELRLSRDANGS
jgi:hypothetical protein